MQTAGCMSTGRESVSYTRWYYMDSTIPHVASPNARLPGDGRWVERELALTDRWPLLLNLSTAAWPVTWNAARV
jgi:hypothetical protein